MFGLEALNGGESNQDDKGEFNKVCLYRFPSSKLPISRDKNISFPPETRRAPSHESLMTCFREEGQGGRSG